MSRHKEILLSALTSISIYSIMTANHYNLEHKIEYNNIKQCSQEVCSLIMNYTSTNKNSIDSDIIANYYDDNDVIVFNCKPYLNENNITKLDKRIYDLLESKLSNIKDYYNKNVFIKLTKTRDNKLFEYDVVFDKNDCISKTNVYIANTSYTIAFACFLASYFVMRK